LSATSAGSASFSYDGLGRRLSKTDGGTTTKFLYDGANVVQEQNSGNTATANLLTGLGIDQTFSRSVVGGATSSLLTDALGSTIALADTSGVIATSYTYEPYGAATSTGAASTNSYQFTGRENDGASGLLFYRARFYRPGISRFISEDPFAFPGGPDPDLYVYVGSNPVQFVDPLGLDGGCGILTAWRCVDDVFRNLWLGIRFIRNVPYTAGAYVWAEINGGNCGLGTGLVVVCTGVNTWATGPRPIVTIGNVILAEDEDLTEAEFVHETKHTDQWAIFGLALPGLYAGTEAVSQATGHGSCWNPFEWWAGFEGGGYKKCL
jgi:RHS repeat-associated protein